jgi:8-oxo-dGTP diphosphatase
LFSQCYNALMITTAPLVAEIRDADFKPGYVSPLKPNDYELRHCARGILLRDGLIAVLYVSKWKYHKLPGGGVEEGEDFEQGFKREVREETGCDCTVTNEQGKNAVIMEYRDEFRLCQPNHLFFAAVFGKPQAVNFTGDEVTEGFQLQWVLVAEAIPLLEKDIPENYEGKFIQKRDLVILNYYKKLGMLP